MDWRLGRSVATTVSAIRMTTTARAGIVPAAPADPRDEALELFAAHGAPLYRFCRCTLGQADDAEDVVQETFLKLLQHLQRGGDRANLRAWLFEVAANACRDRTRWRARWVPWRRELDVPVALPAHDSVDLQRAHTALTHLAPRDRLLLSLRAQGLSYREIARAAAVSEVSVGRLLARAAGRWKKRLGS